MEPKEKKKITKYISDLKITQEHSLKVIRKQKEVEGIKTDEAAFRLIQKLEATFARQVEDLDKAIRDYGEVPSKLKDKLSSVTSWAITSWAEDRRDPVSKNMRDNYTALALITAGYTMLKTVALADENKELQKVVGKNLQELAKLTVSVSKMIPVATAKEIIDDEQEAERISNLAIEKTQKAWSSENVKDRDKVLK